MRATLSAVCMGLLLFARGADAPALKDKITVDLGGGVSIEMVLIRPGSFTMGSEKGEDDEKAVHKVTLTKPFYLGKFEVTQRQWQAVMGDNPSQFKDPDNPVEMVSWEDCQAFLQKLAEKAPQMTFKLPTEAQWEYACRAGSSGAYSFGDEPAKLGEYGWFLDNSGGKAHPVGGKKPNAWGLYDMHGNVCEWCADWYESEYAPDAATDPTGPASGEARVLRGESWVGAAAELRSARRVATPVYYRNSHVGFRLLCLPPE
jgi:formylglycine-generating enzyme required for sulfatase activity